MQPSKWKVDLKSTNFFNIFTYSHDRRRGRLPTEPGPEAMQGYNSPLLTSPIKSPPYNSTGTDSDDNSYKCKSYLTIIAEF